jgi:hypothetical protein
LSISPVVKSTEGGASKPLLLYFQEASRVLFSLFPPDVATFRYSHALVVSIRLAQCCSARIAATVAGFGNWPLLGLRASESKD